MREAHTTKINYEDLIHPSVDEFVSQTLSLNSLAEPGRIEGRKRSGNFIVRRCLYFVILGCVSVVVGWFLVHLFKPSEAPQREYIQVKHVEYVLLEPARGHSPDTREDSNSSTHRHPNLETGSFSPNETEAI